MLNDEICNLRNKLNKSIEDGEDYSIIYQLSVELDDLIANFYNDVTDIARMFLSDYFKGINSFDYIEQIGSVNKDYTEQILNEVFAENKMVLSVINSK